MTSPELSAAFYSSFEEEYHALKEHAAFFREWRGVLRLIGSESVDFLQRLSTNDVDPLSDGAVVTSVLTTEKAKVVDVCTFIPDQGHILVVTSQSREKIVKSWLEKYIIMEDITVEDISSSLTTYCLINAEADSFLSSVLGGIPAIVPRKPLTFEFSGFSFIVIHDDAYARSVHHLVCSKEAFDALCAKGVHRETLQPVGSMAFESFRIEQGVPLADREINLQINPLEASLNRYVSFTKGCYIGQEVIARIDTYKKLQKELRGLIIESPQDRMLSPGSLWDASERIGVTTSHAWSFGLRRQIALGFVKTASEAGAIEYREESGTVSFPARISEFPLC